MGGDYLFWEAHTYPTLQRRTFEQLQVQKIEPEKLPRLPEWKTNNPNQNPTQTKNLPLSYSMFASPLGSCCFRLLGDTDWGHSAWLVHSAGPSRVGGGGYENFPPPPMGSLAYRVPLDCPPCIFPQGSTGHSPWCLELAAASGEFHESSGLHLLWNNKYLFPGVKNNPMTTFGSCR